ncbi:SprT family zinc-dependent metalloprotease [Enterovibrio coralii]|uniref:Protein SprT n=1 Tax=Enterovibrio coralii TaxID=294935 RepID=A0A135I3W4_9GAMM|nr:SprT family zinc-dependent metalloprotease [Enterovibrio coralii]KXF80139.1 Zn-dependent metalloprotease [Enterovibrio coralii]
MNELHYRITRRVSECITIANQQLGGELPVPAIRFDIRGKTAGMALLQRWVLRFNPVLLAENSEAFFQEVVPHEVAHLVVFSQFGKVKPHGKEWQAVMFRVFGIQPKTTHSFDITSVQGKTFLYRCACDEMALTVRRHNKVQRQQAQYICRRCKQPLTYTQIT